MPQHTSRAQQEAARRKEVIEFFLNVYDLFIEAEYRLCLWIIQLRDAISKVTKAHHKAIGSLRRTNGKVGRLIYYDVEAFERDILKFQHGHQERARDIFLNERVEAQKAEVFLTVLEKLRHLQTWTEDTFEYAYVPEESHHYNLLIDLANESADLESYRLVRGRLHRGTWRHEQEDLDNLCMWSSHWRDIADKIRKELEEFPADLEKLVTSCVNRLLSLEQWNQEEISANVEELWQTSWSKLVQIGNPNERRPGDIEHFFKLTFIMSSAQEYALLKEIRDMKFDDHGVLDHVLPEDGDELGQNYLGSEGDSDEEDRNQGDVEEDSSEDASSKEVEME